MGESKLSAKVFFFKLTTPLKQNIASTNREVNTTDYRFLVPQKSCGLFYHREIERRQLGAVRKL